MEQDHLLALYGTIVGTLSMLISAGALGISIHVARRDNARIHPRVRWAFGYWPGATRQPVGYLSFDVVNAGRRPVTIAEFGFWLGNKKLVLGPRLQPEIDFYGQLPIELAEGKDATFLVRPEDLHVRENFQIPPKVAYFQDTTGKRYLCQVPQGVRDMLWGDGSYRQWWQFWR